VLEELLRAGMAARMGGGSPFGRPLPPPGVRVVTSGFGCLRRMMMLVFFMIMLALAFFFGLFGFSSPHSDAPDRAAEATIIAAQA
jgi:hypothetical protein